MQMVFIPQPIYSQTLHRCHQRFKLYGLPSLRFQNTIIIDDSERASEYPMVINKVRSWETHTLEIQRTIGGISGRIIAKEIAEGLELSQFMLWTSREWSLRSVRNATRIRGRDQAPAWVRITTISNFVSRFVQQNKGTNQGLCGSQLSTSWSQCSTVH